MDFLRLEHNGPVATIILDHPDGNRINFQMREELMAAVDLVVASRARVLLVKGAGRDFCLGGDVREWPGLSSDYLRTKVGVFATALDILENLPIPTISVVQGHCMGGGFELALACDFILAASSAHFVFPEAMLGIMTLQGGIYQLAERIGRNKAIEMVFLSEPIGALQMAQWNVVNRVFVDASLDDGALAIAARLAEGPSDAYARSKELMRTWRQGGRAEARRSLYDISMPLFDIPEVQAALQAAADAAKAGRPFPRMGFGS